MSEKVPRDLDSVNSNGQAYLFYINGAYRGRIQYYSTDPRAKGTENNQDKGGLDYKNEETGITWSDTSDRYVFASVDNPAIAAMAYKFNGINEIRIYYKDSSSYLREICHSGDNMNDDWYQGLLYKQNIRLDQNSKLTCCADESTAQLRVFYNPPGAAAQVAHIGMGGKDWQTRPLIFY